MARIIELPPTQRFDPQSILDTFARGRAQEEQKRQFDVQAEMDKQRLALQQQQVEQGGQTTTAQVGQINAAQAQKAAEIWRQTVYDPLIKAGQVDEANKRLGALTIAHPDVAKYAAGERPSTDLDTAASSQATIAKDRSARVAGGSQDVQDQNFVNLAMTNQQLSAPAFADQSQRQAQAEAPPKPGTAPFPLNPNAPQTPPPAYSDFLRRQGGAMTTASEDLTANTQTKLANIHEAGATERERMSNAAPVAAAKERNAPSAPAAYDLTSLDAGTRAKVEMVANYTMNPQSLSLRTDKKTGESERSRIIALAHLANPDFDEKNYNVKAATAKSFAAGKPSANITALNTATGHLAQLDAAIDAMDNGNIQALNKIAIFYKTQTGQSAPVVFNSVKNAVTGELATSFKGSSGTDPEIAHLNETLQGAQSSEQLHSAVNAYLSLMHSRLSGLEHTREIGMGDIKDYRVLSPEAARIFAKHGIDTTVFGKSAGRTSTKPASDPLGLYR